jgi:serine/threonine-protein kinase
MDRGRWEKVQSLFHEAADLPKAEQDNFLENQCGDDSELRAEVMALLREDAEGESILDGDVAQVADAILNDSESQGVPFKKFGPYRIKRALGEGGMGVVYLAEREDLGNEVAIKVLRDAWVSPARRERFASEQRTLAQLNHPSIARLYDANTSADGTPFFVMEYVEGIQLTEYCAEHKCSIAERLRLFRAVCEAVLYAHQQAVIHRDLKPSNILVRSDGTVRLLDFGIAKQIENLGEAVDQTVTALRMMTPAYAAPEQIRGEQTGIQTDVYSLGVILYQLLAARLPFDLSNRTPAQTEKRLTETQAERPSIANETSTAANGGERTEDVSAAAWADLDVLCLTAMHKDRTRRYQSVEALIRDVDHYLKGEPLDARADNWRYAAGKFVSRNRSAVTMAAVVFAMVVALVAFYTWRLTKARNAALAESARTERIQKFMLNLFQGGDEAAGPADSLRVVTLLDRGVQEAKSLDTEPAVQAELYRTLGGIYEKLGKFDQAESLLQTALKERQAIFGPDSREAAESTVDLATLRDYQARLPEAEQLATDGLGMTRRHSPANDPAVAKALTVLGKAQEDRGLYDTAIKTLDEAVKMQSANDEESAEEAASLYELANAHFYAGHYDISEELNERVLALNKKIYGDGHPRVADILVNLGAIQYDTGHYAEAEKYDRQAVAIVQGWYGKDNPETADDLTILARALVKQTRYDEATDLLQQSLSIKERVYGPVHPSVASSLNELGSAALQQGNYDAAEQYFSRMADIYRAVYGEHHYLMATALSNLASVYMKRNQWARAEKIYRQVVPLYTETLSANHINTGIARIKLGRCLLHQQEYAEAATESRAGYEILVKQMAPNVSWLVNAREDLAAEYDAMKRPEEAAQFRAQLASAVAKPGDTAKH